MTSNRSVFLLFSSLATASSVTTAQAVVLAATNFDDAVKSAGSQIMTDISWTGEDLAAFSPATSVETVASNNAGYFTAGFGATGFAPDQNIENEGPWVATFEFTLAPLTNVTLSNISFDYAALTNSGASQGTNFRPQNFDLAVNGVAFDGQQQTTAVNGSLTFTGPAVLNEGLNEVTLTASEVNGPGYNMAIDNLAFEGDLSVIPEPSVAGLGGIALLAFLTRRRKVSA